MKSIQDMKADKNRTISEYFAIIDHHDQGGGDYCVSSRQGWADALVKRLREVFTPERLEEIFVAEKKGLCWTAPCDIGDLVYVICNDRRDHPSWITPTSFRLDMIPLIGKTVFYGENAHKDAAAALEELKNV